MTSPKGNKSSTPGGAKDRVGSFLIGAFSPHVFARTAEVIGAVGTIGASTALVVLLLG